MYMLCIIRMTDEESGKHECELWSGRFYVSINVIRIIELLVKKINI